MNSFNKGKIFFLALSIVLFISCSQNYYDHTYDDDFNENYYEDAVGYSSYPSYLTIYNNKLFFSATDNDHGNELWLYDGVNKPFLVYDINMQGGQGDNGAIMNVTVYNNKLFFTAYDGIHGSELWGFDDINNPEMVYDIIPGAQSSDIYCITILNNTMFFIVRDTFETRSLWKYDGINNPEKIISVTNPYRIIAYNNKIYFTKYTNNVGGIWELWEYDLINAPTRVFEFPNYDRFQFYNFIIFDNKIYFDFFHDKYQEAWVYDGVNDPEKANSVNSVIDFYPLYLTEYNGKYFFINYQSSTLKFQKIWIYDGVNDPQILIDNNDYVNPRIFADFNNKLYFCLDINELWEYDDFSKTHKLIYDFEYDSYGCIITIGSFKEFNGKLYFCASDGKHGYELWQYDGLNTPSMAYNIHEDKN